ncbi:cell wall hydrolase [Phenylobacterium sp.]|uniref:cell wall hydrolase n=1 Tax=Phenylobacterium sp. TaxID=1871053 RepID=UPI0039836C46
MALTVAAAWACAPTQNNVLSPERQAMVTRGLSDAALGALARRMDPAMRGLALRHDPGLQQPDLWNRADGWASLDIRTAPDLGFTAADAQTAQDVNALMPFAGLPIRPMRPFLLKGGGEDRARAQECLSQAVYYESAREPQKGQEAVAQVVLNRVRHPAYPKSVCGVVYQGAARATGCQFTFTCDGSLRWKPEPALWRRAQDVARRALAGHVEKGVGSATHYHASYVAPYWAPTLVKMTQVGAHIFYRWTGPWGEPAAFTGSYAGREANLTQQVLASLDARTQGGLLTDTLLLLERKVTLAMAGEVRTYRVIDPNTPGGERTRVMGTLYAPRRQPTPDEVRKINESLAAVEKSLDAPAAPALVIPPATTAPAKAEAQPAKASG